MNTPCNPTRERPERLAHARDQITLCRRHFLLTGGAAMFDIATLSSTFAQGWPDRYVRIVVPFTAGGTADAVARLLGNGLSEIFGQQVVIENVGGAGGNIGTRNVAQSPADGYALLLGSFYLATNPNVYPSVPYDPFADFAPITMVSSFPLVMTVPRSSPATTVREFIDFARAQGGKLTFASTGAGASPHLSGELFKRMANIELVHVPYRGGGAILNDLLPGRIDVYFGVPPTVIPHHRSGELRALAVTSAARLPIAPDIPTIAESGLPGYEVTTWYGLFAPAKTPPNTLSKVHAAATAALANPSLKQRLEDIGAIVAPGSPAELAVHLRAETDRWAPIIKAVGIKAN